MIKLVVGPYCQNCTMFEPEFEKQIIYSDVPETMDVYNTVIFCRHSRDRCKWVLDNYREEVNNNMSVTLQTSCKYCVHEKVCRNKGIPENIKERLCNANHGQGPNDDYDMDTMSDHYGIDIHIRCKDYMTDITQRG